MDEQAEKLKFYTDKHVPKSVTVQLRKHDIDAVRCEEVGMGDSSDDEHLEYAAREGRIVVTFDKDFKRIHAEWMAQGRSHSGIMFVSRRLQGPDGVGRIVVTLIDYYDLIAGGAGTIEADIADRITFIR